MRRNSIDKNYLNIVLISLFLFFYQVVTSLYVYLPVFTGLFFAYLIIYFGSQKRQIYLLLSFVYLEVYDLNKGFYLFSYLLLFLLFYYFFVEKIKDYITCNNCILAIYIIVAYLGHYAINAFMAYLQNQDLPLFSSIYIYFIGVDIVLSIVLFRGKI